MKKKDTLEEAIAYIESGKQCYYHYRLESKLKPISQDEARELLKDRHWSFGNPFKRNSCLWWYNKKLGYIKSEERLVFGVYHDDLY